jgi:hypothetical protein
MKEQSTLGEQSGTNTVRLGRSGSLMEEGVAGLDSQMCSRQGTPVRDRKGTCGVQGTFLSPNWVYYGQNRMVEMLARRLGGEP